MFLRFDLSLMAGSGDIALVRKQIERPFGVCILAGGLSRRMGRDKTRLRIGGRSMLARVWELGGSLGVGGRVIRQDAVERCGPVGGILTGLMSSHGEGEMFLACDMPFVTVCLLEGVAARFQEHGGAVFVRCQGRVGFPCMVPRVGLGVVRGCVEGGHYALRHVAERLGGDWVDVAGAAARELFNVNSMADLAVARRWFC